MTSSTAPMPTLDGDVGRTLRLGGGAKLRKYLVRAIPIALGLALVLGLGRWWFQRRHRPAPSFVTTPLARGDLVINVTATGTLAARTAVEVGPEISGRVKAVHVDVNQRVHRGQILVEMDPEQYASQVAQGQAQLAQARARVMEANASRRETRATRIRVEELAASGAASLQDRDTAVAADERATASVAVAVATVAQARAAVETARTNLARTVVRSPIDGIVLARDVEVGKTVVAALQAPVLFQIAEDLHAMTVSVNVDEADVGLVHEGAPATFTVAAYLDRHFDARVVSVHNAARLIDRVVTYEAELEVNNADLALRPGMTVTAEILSRRIPQALLVPNQALRFAPAGAPAPAPSSGDRIWLLRDGHPAAASVVTLGQNETHSAIAAPDLGPGATVIVNAR